MVNQTEMNAQLIVNRRTGDRRNLQERRDNGTTTEFDGQERHKTPRRKVERRRQIDPTTCERDYSDDEIKFMKEMDDYKRRSGRQFPTWSEVLEVLRSMGYRQVAEPAELKF
jgi:hypothetical protein